MTAINAYVGFNGACREAMNFYKNCMGGELIIQTIGESPMAANFPAEMKDKVLHSSLTKDALLLMGSDMNSPGEFIKGNNVALSLSCSSKEEINTYFSKLADGGKVMDPLKDQFWGAIFGAVKDKYGINWMLNYDKNQNK